MNVSKCTWLESEKERERELFEGPEIKPLDFVCVVGCGAKFQKETGIYETNCWLAF
jgi:hypothetical protein